MIQIQPLNHIPKNSVLTSVFLAGIIDMGDSIYIFCRKYNIKVVKTIEEGIKLLKDLL